MSGSKRISRLKEGGITALEEKSLGCIQKGGRSPVADVLRYGETARKRGLSLLETPGDDLVSVTAMARGRRAARPVHDRPRDSGRLASASAQDCQQLNPGAQVAS